MKAVLSLLLLAGVIVTPASAFELSGNLAAQLQLFPQQAREPQQLDQNLTFSFQPKLRQDWNEGSDELTVELFMRADNKDDERQHADIRELKWLHVAGNDEWRVGINTVFWGVTESQHLVDVINQIDRLEGLDGEDKLGQPMIQYTTIQGWGVLHLFVLPGFREAAFHSPEGRLRLPLAVDTSQARYQSSDEEKHVDYALRYTRILGDSEIGLSWFEGTNREPLMEAVSSGGSLVLRPYYEQMSQFGLDLQSFIGDWTWKLEMIYRRLDSGSFAAMTGGFEYTFYGIFDSSTDMGTLLEYSWEDRDQNAGAFDNDLFGGLRFAFNDVQSSEILAGMFVDVENGSQSIRTEASRRLGDSWKLSAELQIFTAVDANDPLLTFARDDYVLIELARYF